MFDWFLNEPLLLGISVYRSIRSEVFCKKAALKTPVPKSFNEVLRDRSVATLLKRDSDTGALL